MSETEVKKCPSVEEKWSKVSYTLHKVFSGMQRNANGTGIILRRH